MAWCPFATRMELQPESDSQAAIVPTQFIIHSIAAPWTPGRIYEYWRDSTNLESHFGGGYDGSLAQFIGTETRADANASANRRPDGTGAVSIETASNLQHTDPWTDAQVAALIRLGVWLHQRHGIPLRICRSASDPGFGYHGLHRAWSTSGTACPGAARIRQFHDVVFPGIVRAAQGQPPIPAPRPEPPAPTPVPPVEEDMIVLEDALPVGYDPLVSRVVAMPTVPPGKTAWLNVAADYGAVIARVDVFVNGSWQFVGEGITTAATDNAFWPLPAGARKVAVKRVNPDDALPELQADVAALGEEIRPSVPGSWLIEVV